MAETPTAAKMSLKLLIDTKSKKVLFAESGKEFVDFLFNLLNLPVGTVIRLLTTARMVGSFGNLYKSVETLSDTYMQPDKDKNSLLKPALLSAHVAPLLLTNDDTISTTKFYTCSDHYGSVTDDPKARCPQCRQFMSRAVPYVSTKAKIDGEGGEGGYVKGVVTYIVTDDLVVEPMSTISCVALLNKSGVHELGALEERVVQVGMDEVMSILRPLSGLKLLREAMMSRVVLTNVFLGKMAAAT